MAKPNASTKGKAITAIGRALWLIILVPILAVSGYSLWWVARSLGVPAWIAVAMSTCFDGVALLSANYSVRYAQAGLSGSLPRTVVRLWACLAAYVQTLHVQLGNEPVGAAILWASLPISAVLVYEQHIRWERRKALAAAGVAFPTPLPAFGLVTWVLFPFKSYFSLRKVAQRRFEAIEAKTKARPALAAVAEPNIPRPTITNAGVTDITTARRHSPKQMRAWLRKQPEWADRIGDRARLPREAVAHYNREHNTG